MRKVISIALLFSLLLQIGMKPYLLTKFYILRAEITQTYCENKSKPSMHCDGKCYLKKQMKKEEKKQYPFSLLKEKTEYVVSALPMMQSTEPSFQKNKTVYFLHKHYFTLSEIPHPPPEKLFA